MTPKFWVSKAVEIALFSIPLCGTIVIILSAHCGQLPAETFADIAGLSTFEANPSAFADQSSEEEEGEWTASVVRSCRTNPVDIGPFTLTNCALVLVTESFNLVNRTLS